MILSIQARVTPVTLVQTPEERREVLMAMFRASFFRVTTLMLMFNGNALVLGFLTLQSQEQPKCLNAEQPESRSRHHYRAFPR